MLFTLQNSVQFVLTMCSNDTFPGRARADIICLILSFRLTHVWKLVWRCQATPFPLSPSRYTPVWHLQSAHLSAFNPSRPQ